jgi:hypothetical protein
MKKTGSLPINPAAVAVLAVGFTLATTSCGSGGAPPRDLMAEEVRADTPGERPIAMRGEGTFLDGKLATFVTVSRGFDRGINGPEGGGRGAKAGERGGGRRRRVDASENYPVSFGDSEEEQKEAMEEYIRQVKAVRARGSPMPPVTLRVLFENRGTTPLEVEVTTVDSELGNFAVRPDKFTVAAGEKFTLEPMISQLGVTSDEIPLKLELRAGGKRESQVVQVKNVLAPSLRK